MNEVVINNKKDKPVEYRLKLGVNLRGNFRVRLLGASIDYSKLHCGSRFPVLNIHLHSYVLSIGYVYKKVKV